MRNSTKGLRMTKRSRGKLPKPDNTKIGTARRSLPFNGHVVEEKRLLFSFTAFDRHNELFNLGGQSEDKTVGGKWFIELLDCLKSISDKTILELMNRSTHDLHPIDWSKTNAKPPEGYDQLEYWQFRLNKSRGRVIGTIIDNVFYVMWLDPYHNLTDSEGYGGVQKYPEPEVH